MQFGEIFFYVLLTITITIAAAEENIKKDLITGKKIRKRETSLILDGYPSRKSVKQQPRMVYRKISNQRFRKPSYVTPKSHKRNPPKYDKPSKPYSTPNSSRHKNQRTKYNYGRVKQYKTKNSYYHSEKAPHKMSAIKPNSYNLPSGFGEPPRDIEEFTPKINFAEPPEYTSNQHGYNQDLIKSHDKPFIHSISSQFLSSQKIPSNPNHAEETNKYEKDTRQWQSYLHDESDDSNHAFSKKQIAYSKPTVENEHEHIPLKSYSDVYNYGNTKISHEGKKKMYGDKNKFLNKPWVSIRVPGENQEIVGGQYAEPPARLVSKFMPSASMANDYDVLEPQLSPIDQNDAYFGTISPYVNYKNSNMAFSPQNLNDAFSL